MIAEIEEWVDMEIWDDLYESDARQSNPYTALWRAVLAQAVSDMLRRLPGPGHEQTVANVGEARANKTKALSWMRISNKDFQMVCDMADVSPEFIIRKFTEILDVGPRIKRFTPRHQSVAKHKEPRSRGNSRAKSFRMHDTHARAATV